MQECKHKHCKVHTPVLSAFEPVENVCAAGVVNLIERMSKRLLHRHRITAEQTHTHTHTHTLFLRDSTHRCNDFYIVQTVFSIPNLNPHPH